MIGSSSNMMTLRERKMELYQLKTFVTVADTGNLTQAAERLFTSQPAISAHIKALEEQLDLKLFDRTSKGMRLTENGFVLREKAQLVLNASNDLTLKAQTLQGILTGQAKIGLNTDAEYLKLAKWHHRLLSQYSNLKIQLTQGSSSELLKKISSSRLDVTFFSGDCDLDEIAYKELFTTNAVLVAAPKWEQKLINANKEELRKLPWICPEPLCIYHRLVKRIFKDTKLEPNWVTSSATEDSTIALIKSGVGIAFVRDDEAEMLLKKEQVVVYPNESFSLPLRVGYLKSREDDPVVKALLEVIVNVFESQQ